MSTDNHQSAGIAESHTWAPGETVWTAGESGLKPLRIRQRVVALLLDISDMTGQPVVGCRQDILAMAAAARRETVATILSSWRDEDWIQTRYRRCKVLDRDALIRIRDRQNGAS